MPVPRFNMSLDGQPHPTSQMLGSFVLSCLGHDSYTRDGTGRVQAARLARSLGYEQAYWYAASNTLSVDMCIWEGQHNYVIFVYGTENLLQFISFALAGGATYSPSLACWVQGWAKLQAPKCVDTTG